MKTYIRNLFKTLSLQIISLLLIFGGVFVYAAISSFPSAPSGGVDGGKFMNYFNKILVNTGSSTTGEVKLATTAGKLLQGNCGSGNIIRGFDANGDKICVSIATAVVLPNVPATTYYPGCDTADIDLGNGQVWAACNVGSGVVAGSGIASYGDYFTFNEAQTVCTTDYKLPSKSDWQLAFNSYSGYTLGESNNLATKLMLPLAGIYNPSYNMQGSNGFYWSSTNYPFPNWGFGLSFNNISLDPASGATRSFRNSVRCIRKSTLTAGTTQTCPILNGTGSKTWNGSSWGTCTVQSCKSGYEISGNLCVPGCNTADITLSNGQVWSACNVGASNPTEYGYNFTWNDALGVCQAPNYRLPSYQDWKSAYDSYSGQTLGNPNNLATKLSLSLAGYYNAGNETMGEYGYYWSSTPYNDSEALLSFFSINNFYPTGKLSYGPGKISVRCINNQSPIIPASVIPLPTYYSGCTTPDITLSNGQTWAACNVGSNVAGFGSQSYGNYYTFNEAQTVCANGYHLPTSGEWGQACNLLIGTTLCTSQTVYFNPAFQNILYLPAAGVITNNNLSHVGTYANFWTSTAVTTNGAFTAGFGDGYVYSNGASLKNFGYSVRCIKDTPPPTCTSFTYSDWGACQSNGTQSRTVISSSPSSCTGGNPVTSQDCTVSPITAKCTGSGGIVMSDGTTSFCKFTGGYCPSGWTQYKNYSATVANTCTDKGIIGEDAWGNLNACYTCPYLSYCYNCSGNNNINTSVHSCTTPNHEFSNSSKEILYDAWTKLSYNANPSSFFGKNAADHNESCKYYSTFQDTFLDISSCTYGCPSAPAPGGQMINSRFINELVTCGSTVTQIGCIEK